MSIFSIVYVLAQFYFFITWISLMVMVIISCDEDIIVGSKYLPYNKE